MNTVLAPNPEFAPEPAPRFFLFGNPDKTKGSILVLSAAALDESGASCEAGGLAADFQVCYLLEPIAAPSEQEALSNRLAAALEAQKLKRLTVIGFGANAALAMRLTLNARELVRRLLLVDASSHEDDAVTSNFLARIDRLIPYGLPLAANKMPNDFRSMAHRLRCPSLLLNSRDASAATKAKTAFLETRMPNARLRTLGDPIHTPSGAFSAEMEGIIREFMDVPAKRSQKNE